MVTSGYLGLRAVQNQGGTGREAARRALTGSIRSRLQRQDNTILLQMRPIALYSSAPGVSGVTGSLDEFYWERRMSPALFAFAGRRRIVNGVAIGRNPSDFLNAAKPEDRTLTDEDRRSEKKGDDLIGWSYFGQAYSVQAMALTAASGSKRTRALFQVAGNIDALSTDYSVIGYVADRPGFGLNLSTVWGEKTTAYAEAAIRRGRDRPRPVLNASQLVVGAADDTGRWFSDVVLGGQYTSASGLTLTTEYWRNANGFCATESTALRNAVVAGQGNAQVAAALLNVSTLRQQALFFRISGIPIPLSARTTVEATAIVSLDDNSRFLRSALNWDRSASDAVRAGVDRFYGPALTEYGVNQVRWRLFLAYKHYF